MRPRQTRAEPGRSTARRASRTTPEADRSRYDHVSDGSEGTAARRGMAAVVAAMAAGTPEEVTGYDETARRAAPGHGRKPA